mgnify:CR=1 FL=1
MGGFNFGQFLGGMSRQISENIEDSKKFQREKDFRLEMLAEEEATKDRLAKSAERRAKAAELEELTATLAGYFGADNAAATVKTLGVGASKDLLKTAQNFDHTTGDFATAFKFPEIKNGTFGKDLVTAGSSPNEEVKTTIPITLTDIYKPEKKTDDKTIDTEVKFSLLMKENQVEINQMPDGTVAQREAKELAQAEWDQQMKAYTDVVNKIAAAKREGKPEKAANEFYTPDQIKDLLNGAIDVEFSLAVGFAGEKAEYKGNLKGSNTVAYSRVMGLISEQTTNLDFRNDINLTKEATARYHVAKDSLRSFALRKSSPIYEVIKNNNGLTPEMINNNELKDANGDIIDNFATMEKPHAIMDMTDFMQAASDNTLRRQGIYLIKLPDNSLQVATFLGKNNIFDPDKRSYIIHRTIPKVPDSIFEKIIPQTLVKKWQI